MGDLVKERLTGAIILVALIVLLVPELLTGPIKSAPRAVASSAEEPPLRSYTIDLGDDAHARGTAPQPQSAAPEPLSPAPAPAAAGEVPAQATSPQAPSPGATENAPSPAAPAGSTPRAEPSPTQSMPAAAAKPQPPAPSSGAGEAGGAWMVQLGSFASRANAEHLAQQLKGQGFSASVSQGSSGRHLYRVRVGPVRERGGAAQLQAKLKAAGHSGTVVPK